MKAIEKTLKISSVRTVGEMIYLDLTATDSSLTAKPKKIPRPEDVIEPQAKSESEKIGRDITRGMVEEFRRSGMPTLPSTNLSMRLPTQLPLSLMLTVNEYEKLGKPTVLDGIKIKIEVA